MDYPITATELARRLGFGPWPESTYAVSRKIRPLLSELACAKTGPDAHTQWLIDERTAAKVAERLGRRLDD